MLATLSRFGLILISVCAIESLVRADDFHVVTDLYNDGGTKSVSTNVTIFQAGRVYDFFTRQAVGETRDDSAETQVSIFDPLRGRFVLLDPGRRVKVEIEKDRLVELSGSQRTWAAKQNDPLLKFSAEPRFTEVASDKPEEIRFNGSALSYRVVSFVPDSPEVAKQYREFTDAYARLNAVTNPGTLPPFPRLAVNESLAKRNAIPREVELTIPPKNNAKNLLSSKPLVRRTEHQFEWHITPGDEEKIGKAGQWLAEFKRVSLDEYIRTLTAVAQK